MMTKIGRVWVSVDSKGNVTKVHGTGLTGPVAIVEVTPVVVDAAALKDPFTLVLEGFGLNK